MGSKKDIQAFFLEAKAHTYETDAPKTSIADLPGSKVHRYEHGDFLYVDCWFSSGTKSFGQTVICVRDRPVWGMQYHGRWEGDDERVIPFLKRALLSQKSFNGEEEIREGGTLLFSHAYSGMML